MNQGFPGGFARNGDCVISAKMARSTDAAGPNFGDWVVLNQDSTGGTVSSIAQSVANGRIPVTTDGTNYQVIGVAVREVKTNLGYAVTQPITPLLGSYSPGEMCDVLERGAISLTVTNPQNTANAYVANAKTYLRIALNGAYPAAKVGDLEISADGGNTIQLPYAFLTTGVVDSNYVAEVTIKYRPAP